MSIQPDVILAACPVCGDPTVKLDHVQKCMDAMRARLRHFQLMAKNMATLVVEGSPLLTPSMAAEITYERAGGGCICGKCGLEYFDHPKGSLDFLTLLCSGIQVKL